MFLYPLSFSGKVILIKNTSSFWFYYLNSNSENSPTLAPTSAKAIPY